VEELKPLADLAEPDERQRFFVVRETAESLPRRIGLPDIYALAEQARLHRGVPEDIRSHFAMAQNLLAYSWFCYPFNVAAELHAYISVEFALKTRFPEAATKSFSKLLALAVGKGLLRTEGFTYGQHPTQQPYPPELAPPTDIRTVRDYVADVAEAVRVLRNSLAHGAPTLHMKGGAVLLVCSEIINQLFPEASED